jgi:hypothetical protein
VNRHLPFLLLPITFGLGCDRNLGTLDGHDLGRPESVVFNRNENGHIMIVMSDLEDLCDELSKADPPSMDNYWVVSAWTNVGVAEEGEYAVEAYASVASHKDNDEYDTEAGGVEFLRMREDIIKAKVDVTFPGNDRLKARVKARHCAADLFVGMR